MQTNAQRMQAGMTCCGPERRNQSGLRERFRAQLGKPTGLAGRVAGWILANRPSNRERNAWAVSMLDIQPTDRVLEIGFGPGLAVELMSKLATKGHIVGIDHSEVMLKQARKRDAWVTVMGRVTLMHGSVSDLPLFDVPFDKILAVNSIQLWQNSTAVLRELRRLLNPGGRIALALQPRFQGATNADTHEAGRDMVERLNAAGFSQVRLEIKSMRPVSVACAVGINEG